MKISAVYYRTTHLVEQLLTLARLEPELLANDFADVDLSSVIKEECALLSPLAIKKNIDISFEETDVEAINGHEPSLRLLVRNLLMNAISYTPTGGRVSISLAKQKQKTVLVVEDSGPGILEEDRESVIERFYRVNNQQAPGCGIGLSIVDRVVQMHRGSLVFSRADSGQGLKVVIQL